LSSGQKDVSPQYVFRIPLPYQEKTSCIRHSERTAMLQGGLFMSKTKVLCRTAMTGALCFVLTLVSVRAGNLKVSFGSLPAVISALLFGPWEAAAAAFIGELLSQLLTYGLTATTVLWLIPPCLRVILIGMAARRCHAVFSVYPEEKPAVLFPVCLCAAVVTTSANTVGIWLDSLIYGYYTFAYVFGDFVLRIITGLLTASAIAAVSIPVVRALRRVPFLTQD
jgi:ECF transporter S component (folate family)